MKANQKVVVLGASSKPDRVSNQAIQMLKEYKHQVFPVNPQGGEINGLKVYDSLADVPQPIDTISLYLNPENLKSVYDEIIQLKPGRVLFSPGTESPELYKKLEAAGIPYQEACTLVLLRTGQF